MKTPKRKSKHRPGLSRMLTEAGPTKQSKVMYVIKGLKEVFSLVQHFMIHSLSLTVIPEASPMSCLLSNFS